jgi:hypothetical protein
MFTGGRRHLLTDDERREQQLRKHLRRLGCTPTQIERHLSRGKLTEKTTAGTSPTRSTRVRWTGYR